MHVSTQKLMGEFVKTYVKPQFENKKSKIKVLDLGSQDVNGTYKHYFEDAEKYEYTGADMADGKNVDVVLDKPYDLHQFKNNQFDVCISGQVLEHVEFPWRTMEEMTRVCKPEGLICVIVPFVWPRHRYPLDCFRYDVDGMIALARYCKLEILHASATMTPPNCTKQDYIEYFMQQPFTDAVLMAKKPKKWTGVMGKEDYSNYVFEEPDRVKYANGWDEFNLQLGGKFMVQQKVAEIVHAESEPKLRVTMNPNDK